MKTTKMSRMLAAAVVAGGCIVSLPAVSQAQTPQPPRAANPQQSATAQASKQVLDANLALRKAQQDLAQCKLKLESQYKNQPDWVKAHKALEKAEVEYNNVKQHAQDSIHAAPEYIAAQKAKAAAKERFAALQDDPQANAAEIDTVGTNIAQQATIMSRLEHEALAGDPKVADAKSRYDEAEQQMNQLKAQVDEAAKADPACIAAQQAVDQAQQQVASAQQSLLAVRKAEAEARAAERASKATPTRSPRR